MGNGVLPFPSHAAHGKRIKDVSNSVRPVAAGVRIEDILSVLPGIAMRPRPAFAENPFETIFSGAGFRLRQRSDVVIPMVRPTGSREHVSRAPVEVAGDKPRVDTQRSEFGERPDMGLLAFVVSSGSCLVRDPAKDFAGPLDIPEDAFAVSLGEQQLVVRESAILGGGDGLRVQIRRLAVEPDVFALAGQGHRMPATIRA